MVRSGGAKTLFGRFGCQTPAARGVRAAVAATHIVADRDRMGALAVHECAETGRICVALTACAATVLHSHDSDQARRLRGDDDNIVDQQQTGARGRHSSRWTRGVTAAVDVALPCRFCERFADHAVLIGPAGDIPGRRHTQIHHRV